MSSATHRGVPSGLPSTSSRSSELCHNALSCYNTHCGCSPLLQQRDMVAATRAHGIVVEAYSSLAQGDARLLQNRVLRDIATSHSKTCAQVALRWAVQQGIVVIPKSGSKE